MVYLDISINKKCRLNSVNILHNSNHKHTAQAKVIPNYHEIQTRYLKNTQNINSTFNRKVKLLKSIFNS